jgi:hypothetical protein
MVASSKLVANGERCSLTHVRERDNVNNMWFFIPNSDNLALIPEPRELKNKRLDGFIMENKLVRKIVPSLEMLQCLREVGTRNPTSFPSRLRGVCFCHLRILR